MADESLEDEPFAGIEAHVAEIVDRNRRRMREYGIQVWIASNERSFADTGNPLLVWDTIRICGEKGVPLPDWITAYLLKSASRIMEIAEGSPKTAPKQCLYALGFRSPRWKESPFENWIRWTRREPACLDFGRRICRGEPYKNARAAAAAAFRLGETTLEAWLHEFFPGKGGREEWSEFFKQELDLGGPRFNTKLAALMVDPRTETQRPPSGPV